MATYNINSAAGKKQANAMKAGETFTASDGSVWTKGADGSVSVQKNGQTMQGVVGSSPSYNIGSETGYNVVNSLASGGTYTAKDGSVWTKNPDGTLGVMKNGVYMNGNVTYQAPQKEESGYDEEFIRQILEGLPEYMASEYGDTEYDARYRQLLDEAVNMQYDDWTKGEQYKALADRYSRNGKLSMQDVLAQIASRTGGLASSYAESVAQQQYNEYMQMLEEAARGQFADERAQKVENAGLYGNAASEQFNRFIQQENLRQQAASSAASNALEKAQLYMTMNDSSYNKSQNSRSEAQQRIQNFIAAGGKVSELDADLVKKSGYTTAELNALSGMNGQSTINATPIYKPTGNGQGGTAKNTTYNTLLNNINSRTYTIDRVGNMLDTALSKGLITQEQYYTLADKAASTLKR